MIEIEYQQRVKQTKDQYELVQKKHNELTIKHDQLKEKLTTMQHKTTQVMSSILTMAKKRKGNTKII